MKVLVIDDEEDVRYVARVSLGRVGGMTVIEAANGEEGLDRARHEAPDFILLDMMMPGMDGTATLRELQADAGTTGIPVIFMTAKSHSAEIDHLRDLGARGVVLKPFDPLTLPGELRTMLAT